MRSMKGAARTQAKKRLFRKVKGYVGGRGRLYRTAKALIFAGREDFGMVAVEAQSCGCPVIAFGAGGLVETVRDGANGLLFDGQSEADVIAAVERFETQSWTTAAVTQGVEEFSRETFKAKVKHILENLTPQIAFDPRRQTP